MSHIISKILFSLGLAYCLLSSAGCGGASGSAAITAALSATSPAAPGDGGTPTQGDSPKTYARALTACNPLTGTTQAAGNNLGLSARLYYATNGAEYSNVEDYMNEGADLGVDIFFNQVDVIPTYFASGFPSEAGTPFALPDGTVLIEWFGIRYLSTLQLGPGDQPGNYQLATLSDDGSILYLDPTGGDNLAEFVNNDGEHATQMGCSTQTLSMTASSQIPIRLDYFQGPRYHLTSMLLWRRVPAGGSLDDPACGVQGINTFFDTTQTPSAPQPYYQQMLARGWEVVQPQSFILPDSNPENPCFPGNGILGD